jgi:peroxiredoxin Q/BCP
MVSEGQKAPAFDLASSEGGRVRLSDLGGKTVVLYFYPRDNTPGCTREACAFRDASARIRKKGAVLLGVSPDTVDAHAGFREKYRLDFPLLADTDRAVAKAYGAFGPKTSYGRKTVGMIRSTFVIDGTGVVRKVFPKVKVDGHAEEVLAALEALGG